MTGKIERLVVGTATIGVIGCMFGTMFAHVVASQGGDLYGPIHVIDGDTIKVGSTSVRIFGIDAPEIRQTCAGPWGEYACGQEAKAAMVELSKLDRITCQPINKDRYGRTVATCSVHGYDVGQLMVTMGWAVAYHGREGETYRAAEASAKADRVGVWAGSFTAPDLFRKGKKS